MIKRVLISLLLAFNLSVNAEEVDPFEETNRSIYEFNESLDSNVLEPVSRAYKNNIPEAAQKGIGNFLGNLADVSTLANQILQFKPIESAETLARILVNTTIGLGGLFDVASDMGLITEDEDFGQTMAVWGVEQGPYVVLPLLGPSTVRDGIGTYVDLTSPANMVGEIDEVGVSVINVVDKRVDLLPITDILDQSDDPYITMRSSYLQKRNNDIYDGNVPVTDDDF
ncbi:VacJ family lipoprotein [Candidatus Thioglobus sp.]|jgi:phospholipid-binding lipoprotein MlaA|uniref:MlaA family lipoprotein n=1 Tax=Candidatus Thioglobus sp. TaxID=2026721 RepID=UPI002636371E|nr:VacJ family lipoprotein [Candidatus Thioglobus sp.]